MADRPGPIVLLTNRQPLHYLLARRLAEAFDLRQVIYERQGLGKSLRLIARRARRIGWTQAAGQLAYVAFDRLYVQPASRPAIEQLLAGFSQEPPGPELPQVEVNSINEPEAAQVLEAAQPRVCVVAGTSIIQSHILEKAPVFLNIHAGITPRYRGAHGAFWAIYEGRPDLAGVTVHLVDQGIDTGGIVAQALIQPEAHDTPRTLVARQYLAAWPLLVSAIRAALGGTLTTRRRDDLDSRLWYSPTLASYWQYRRQLHKITSLPLTG